MSKIILLLVMITLSCTASEIVISEKQQKDLGVKIQKVSSVNEIPYGPYNGVVQIDNKDNISMGARVASTVVEIYVKKFDRVKKGQKLYTLLSTTLLNMQSEYIKALIDAEIVNENYLRNQKLQKEGIISTKQLLASKKLKESSDLQLKLTATQLKANGMSSSQLKKIQKTHLPITKLVILAPKDGLVASIEANIGDVVSPEKGIMSIYADGERFIELSVPVKVIDKIAVGDRCSFGSYEASISTIGNVVDTNSLSVLVRAHIKNAKDIMINRVYQVEIYKVIHDGMKVKKSALVFNEQDAFVFKKSKNGFEAVAVEVLKEGPSCYILKGDLDAQSSVAVSSTSALLSAMEEESE